MTPRGPQSGIPPIIRKPPIAEDLDKLREKPPRATNRETLSTLERMAILDGLCDGDAPGRIATQWKYRQRPSEQFDKLTTNGKRGVPCVKETGIVWLLT